MIHMMLLRMVFLFFLPFLLCAQENSSLSQMEIKNAKLFVATKALINHGGKILILRESNQYTEGTNAGFFDVVGGRMIPGERWDECLMREIKEETGLDVKIGQPFFVSEWRRNVNGEQWQIVGIFFECFADSDEVKLGNDHDEYKWIDPRNFEHENLISSGNGTLGLRFVFEAYLEK